MAGLAAHQAGDGEGGDAVGDVHPDLGVGPVVHRGERYDLWVFELPEPGFGVGLGAVAGDYLGYRPSVRQTAFSAAITKHTRSGPRLGKGAFVYLTEIGSM